MGFAILISMNTIYSIVTILAFFSFLSYPYILFSLIKKSINGSRANVECFILMVYGLIIWNWFFVVFSYIN